MTDTLPKTESIAEPQEQNKIVERKGELPPTEEKSAEFPPATEKIESLATETNIATQVEKPIREEEIAKQPDTTTTIAPPGLQGAADQTEKEFIEKVTSIT